MQIIPCGKKINLQNNIFLINRTFSKNELSDIEIITYLIQKVQSKYFTYLYYLGRIPLRVITLVGLRSDKLGCNGLIPIATFFFVLLEQLREILWKSYYSYFCLYAY